MILHLDLDSFFVSAERTLRPELRGIPVIVGGRGDPFIFDAETARQKRLVRLNRGAFVPQLFHAAYDTSHYFFDNGTLRGIVMTASYEARACGVATAMTLREALRLCPNAVLLAPDHLLYHTLSHRLIALLEREIPVVEQYSIDEAFGDVGGWVERDAVFSFIARLQRKILYELGLPISIGASDAKWIAKLATSQAKPYGLKVVRFDDIEAFVRDIPIEAFPGVGRAFGKKMRRYGIATVGDAWRSEALFRGWGRQGRELYARLRGIDGEKVHPNRSRKGIGISRNMDRPIFARKEFFRRVTVLVRHWAHTIEALGVNPTTFAFRIGYEGGMRSKKQYTVYRLFNEDFLLRFALEKFRELDVYPRLAVRSIGMNATKFLHNDPKTLDLWHLDDDRKMQRLDAAVTKMRDRYGLDVLRRASELNVSDVV